MILHLLHPKFNIGRLSYCSDSEQNLLRAALNMWQEMYTVNQALQLDKRTVGNLQSFHTNEQGKEIYEQERNIHLCRRANKLAHTV